MLSRIRNGVVKRVLRRRFAPKIDVKKSSALIRLGSAYGGWVFEDSSDLLDSNIVSCGLGEDASFDVEFAAKYHARVIVVDPTPRAIVHFSEITARIGQQSLQNYVSGGKQPVTAYDLSELSANSLTCETVAVWVENTTLKFYAPANPAHVSHSIVNFQNDYSQNGAFIEVPALTLQDILARHGLTKISLLKLDIEGAEVEVIKHILKTSILPRQILVEFDEMNAPSARSKGNAESTDAALRSAGYACLHFDGISNFLYVRTSA